MKKKVLIFVVCYNAEYFIQGVLNRISNQIRQVTFLDIEILIIDDASVDRTFNSAVEYIHHNRDLKITLLCNPKNQGYGGNQKIGYLYAIQNHFDVVVLIHGDGQYPPELILQIIEPILSGEADVVFGSRMIHKRGALKGNMPLYKWLGNQILTYFQNLILKSTLSEFHSGYRAYSVPTLASIPFNFNSSYFDFDTDIIIQLLDTNKRIKEIAIPTFYGNEISRVNGIKYAILIIRSSLLSRFMRYGIFYHPKFDYSSDNTFYKPKLGFPSSHQFALEYIDPGTVVLDIGCGPGYIARELFNKQVQVISVDHCISTMTKQYSFKTIEVDIENYDFDFIEVDNILLLDVIEHLKRPDLFLSRLRENFSSKTPKIVITTGNIAFFPIRLGLLFGQFNYGKAGILDLDHTRLFTFASMRRMLLNNGFEILQEKGIPAPFPLAFGDGLFSRVLLFINGFLIYLSKSLFSYQMIFVVKLKPTLEVLLQHATISSQRRQGDIK